MNEDWIAILETPLDAQGAIAAVGHRSVGAIDVFLGTTRAEMRDDGVTLAALEYEAYAEMAIEQLRAIVAEARKRWPVARACILHRVGRVAVSEPSVVIAVSCPHRAESFEACRFVIDELKRIAAIWKREVWADESTSWVAGNSDGATKRQSDGG